MKYLFTIVLFIMALTSVNSQSLSKTQKAAIDSLMAQYAGDSLPSASLAILRGEKVLYKKSYGMADIEAGKKASSKSNYRLASVSKQFTAAAVLQLIEKKKFTLQTTLSDIYKDFPEYGRGITIHHLLNHTSGLVDYEALIPDSATVQVKDADVLAMMKGIDSVYFKPGEKYQYSNTGYALLAMIVEKFSGMKYPAYLRKYIFGPASMKFSVAYVESENTVPNRSYGYSIRMDTVRRTDQSVTSAVLGDGGIYSSVDDLIRWNGMILKNRIISKKSWALACSRKTLNDSSAVNYGYGWHLKTWRGYECVYHTGSTIGFRNILYRIPSEKLTVILLTNRNSGAREDMAEKLMSVVLSK